MTEILDEKSWGEKPRRLAILLPLASMVIGGGALWYACLRYNAMLNFPDLYWYGWISLAAMTLVGILCLSATVLFLFRKSSGLSVFKAGLSIIPLLLFSNLVILIFRVIQNIFQGNAQSFFDRLITNPKILLIPIIVLALILLGHLGKDTGNKTDE